MKKNVHEILEKVNPHLDKLSLSSNQEDVELYQAFSTLKNEYYELYKKVHNPQINNFLEDVKLEAIYQQTRWDDKWKEQRDWHALIVYLSAKALFNAKKPASSQEREFHIDNLTNATANWKNEVNKEHSLWDWHTYISEISAQAMVNPNDVSHTKEKKLHRIITIAAAALNWYQTEKNEIT